MTLLAAPTDAAQPILDGFGLTEQGPSNLLASESKTVTVPGGVGLVSNGAYTATGTLSEEYLFNRRLHVAVGRTSKRDTSDVGAGADPTALSSRSRTLNLSGAAWSDGNSGLTLAGSAMEMSRAAIDENTDLSMGEERSHAVGGGLNFTGYDNRLRGLAELAWSFDRKPELSEDRGLEHRQQADSAWRLRLDADLLRQDRHALSAWAYRRRIDPGYTAPLGDAPANRNEIALGGQAQVDIATLDVSLAENVDNLDRRKDVLTRVDRTAAATIGFDLNRFRWKGLVPKNLRLTASYGRLLGRPGLSHGAFAPDAIPDEQRSGFGIAADWPVRILGRTGTLTLTATTSTLNNRQPEKQTADIRNRSIGIAYVANHALWRGTLSATAAGSRTLEAGNRSRTRTYNFAASAETTAIAAHRLSLAANITQNRISGLDFAVNGDIDTTWEIKAGAEIDPFLEWHDFEHGPALIGYVRVKGNHPDETDAGIRTVGIAAGLKATLTF